MTDKIKEAQKLMDEAQAIIDSEKDQTVGTIGTEVVEVTDNSNGIVLEKAETGKGYQISGDMTGEVLDMKGRKLLRLSRD